MNASTLSAIESAVNIDESLTPEQATLFLQMVNGTGKHQTIKQVTETCNVDTSTVRAWCWNGKLDPCDRVEGCFRFAHSDVWRVVMESSGEEP